MADFKQALPSILAYEGGYSDDPNDPGEETYCGISKRYHPTWPGWAKLHALSSSIKRNQIFPELAGDVANFYRENYWYYDRITSQRVASKLFDMGVNLGTNEAVELVQEAANNVSGRFIVIIDGKYGSETEQAINSQPEEALLNETKALLCMRYAKIVMYRPASAIYLHGWMRRAVKG